MPPAASRITESVKPGVMEVVAAGVAAVEVAKVRALKVAVELTVVTATVELEEVTKDVGRAVMLALQ